jgi:hypothetical protein
MSDGGSVAIDGGVVVVAGPPGMPARLLFLQDTSSSFADGGRRPLFSAVFSIPPNSSVPPMRVQSFALQIPSPTAVTHIRMEGSSLLARCQNDNLAPQWNGSFHLQISQPDGGALRPAGGILRCHRTPGGTTPCDDGFTFTTTIPAGALAVGQYTADFLLGSTCTTTLWAGSADFLIGESITMVTQYP